MKKDGTAEEDVVINNILVKEVTRVSSTFCFLIDKTLDVIMKEYRDKTWHGLLNFPKVINSTRSNVSFRFAIHGDEMLCFME